MTAKANSRHARFNPYAKRRRAFSPDTQPTPRNGGGGGTDGRTQLIAPAPFRGVPMLDLNKARREAAREAAARQAKRNATVRGDPSNAGS